MQTERVFHYTNVESLALILQSKKIRFTRLDRFDDVIEAQTHGGIGFGKYFFASCWTQDETESIAQWSMYGNKMGGVRIELPAKPFRSVKLEQMPGFNIQPGTEFFAPLGTKELFGKSYFVMPLMAFGDEFFQGRVNYVSDVERRWAEAVTRVPDPTGSRAPGLNIKRIQDLARMKSDVWSFQAEYRFSVFALPMLPVFEPDSMALPSEEQIMSGIDAIELNIDPIATHIDIPLDPSAFDKLTVRTGPLSTHADRLLVEALVRQFAPNATLATSTLAGKIRNRA